MLVDQESQARQAVTRRAYAEGMVADGHGEASRWQVIRIDQTGLTGTTARLLTPDPTDDAGWPADLPPGTTEVVLADDTPGPLLTLRVHPVGDSSKVAYVRFDQLAVHS